jgi:hypothetical protein
MSDLKIIYKHISEIKPYANNPRQNDDGVDAVAASIKEFGFKVPVIIDAGGEIIAGHTRIKAAEQLGLTKIPCVVADDLTEAQVKAFRIVDNRVAELSTWDYELLQIELDGIDMDLSIYDIQVSPLEFEDFDGPGDGGGSQMATGNKVRVVIGPLMFDIPDDSHQIYKRASDADEETVKAQIVSLISSGDLL